MNTLITGASGFVGQNLLPYLQVNNITGQALSLRDKDWRSYLKEDFDAIVRLAGKAHDTQNTSVAEDYFKVNTQLTQELFDLFLQSNARDFIYFSSVKATADTISGLLTEDHLSNPATPYGQSKLKAELYILSQPLPAGKRVFILRPCMIHGPGNKGNLNLLYKFVAKGIPYPLAAFENRRSFLSVENLCYVIKELLQRSEIPGGIYNVADDDALSTNEVVRTIAQTLGRKPKLMSIPRGLLQSLAKVGDMLHLPLNSERLKKLTENYVVSNAKLKAALGLERLPIDARNGLSQTIQSFSSE